MQLNHKKFGDGFPIVILHGLLGSLDNWQSIAKKLAEPPSQFAVYIVDQRNHGKSPHTSDFSYELLANDLAEFFEQQKISKADLIGHSMGGKTAMKFALEHPEQTGKLVVVDIAPSGYEDTQLEVFQALLKIDLKKIITRDEVRDILRKELDNEETTVQFLMKGLTRDETASHFEWKFNLQGLWSNYERLGEEITSSKPFTRPALFVKGSKSNYINSSNYHEVVELFPNNQFLEIKDAGHWVHADKPAEFTEEVLKFLME